MSVRLGNNNASFVYMVRDTSSSTSVKSIKKRSVTKYPIVFVSFVISENSVVRCLYICVNYLLFITLDNCRLKDIYKYNIMA